MNKLSVLISRVLDPIIVIPFMLLFSVSNALLNGERAAFLIFISLIDVVLPGFVLAYFIQKKHILSGWDVRKRSERIPLFLFVVLSHAVVVLMAWYFQRFPLAYYLTTFWILTVIYTIFTFFWKISVHVGVIASLVVFLILTQSVYFTPLYAIVPLMIWARVYGKYHTLSQAVAGAIVPSLVIPFCFYLFGIL